MNILFRRQNLPGVLLCVLFSIPAASMAASMTNDENSNSITVSFADLNLSQEEGVKTLYGRLKLAARQSCGSADTRDLQRFRLNRKCIETALANAVERIDNEQLKQLHSS